MISKSNNKLIIAFASIFLCLIIGFFIKDSVVLALSGNKTKENNATLLEKVFAFVSIIDNKKIKNFEEVSIDEDKNKFDKNTNSLYINNFEIPSIGKAVVANLDSMLIKTYENGLEVNEFKIIAIGKDADSSETTPGKFEILSKETNHFSRISKVWMPYSMQFFGNFFIHGWPYYPSGVPISSKNSGGCIRVANADAAKLFKFVEIGTPVILTGNVTKNNFESDFIVNPIKLYDEIINASSYLVANLDTDEVLFEKNIDQIKPMYSITKLMTALVYLETLNQKSSVFINNSVFIDESEESNLQPGDYIKMKDLIYPLLMQSSNVSANIITQNGGKDRMVESMNKRSVAFDLKNTKFFDVSGKSSDNVSTAEDIFKLIKYLSKYKNYLIDISLKKEYKSYPYTWNSKSPYIDEIWYRGGIMDYNNVDKNSGVFIIQKGEEQKQNFIIILLDTKTIKEDVDLILDLL